MPGPFLGPGRNRRARTGPNPLAPTMEASGLLAPDDLQALRDLPFRELGFAPGHVVEDEDEYARRILLVMDGIAAVRTDFPDGTRQITEMLVAGDLHGLGGILGLPPGHVVAAVTRLRVATVDIQDLTALLALHPRVYAALFWASHRRERVLRDHVLIVGRRHVRKRLAHLLCCLQARCAELGANAEQFRIGVTQAILADTIGTTTVHLGRILRELSRERLLRMGRCDLTVVNDKRLRTVAEFSPDG